MTKRISVIVEFPLTFRYMNVRLGAFLSLTECETLLKICVRAVADFLDPMTNGTANYIEAMSYLEDYDISEDVALKYITEIEKSVADEVLKSFMDVGRCDFYYEGVEHVGQLAFVIHFTQR